MWKVTDYTDYKLKNRDMLSIRYIRLDIILDLNVLKQILHQQLMPHITELYSFECGLAFNILL